MQQLTSTVTKSSGSSSATFYVYDFQNAGDGSTSYYFKSDDYTSRGGRGTYTIKSTTFTAPTSGSDIYYSISNSYQTSGRAPFRDEFVTCGGISLGSINPSTLESRHVSCLYFAGEVLDIDGVTGGFNFQAAWTTAYAVALSIAKTAG